MRRSPPSSSRQFMSLGMFVKPMQPLPVADVEHQFEFRAAESQAILDRRRESIDPFPGRREMASGAASRVSCSWAARRARSASSRSIVVPGLDDAIGESAHRYVRNRLDIPALRFAVTVRYRRARPQ